MPHRITLCAAICLALSTTPASLARAPEALAELELHEPLDRHWDPEWVALPVELPEGQCRPQDLWLTDSDGRKVEHVFDVKRTYDDGTVREATAYVRTGLTPAQTRSFAVVSRPGKTHDDLLTKLIVEGGDVIIRCDRIRVRSEVNTRTYTPPADAGDVSPPISAIWRSGHPRLVQFELEDVGPVSAVELKELPCPPHQLAREVRYDLADGGRYVFRYTLTADEPAVVIEEDFRTLSRGGLRLRLSPKLTMGQVRGRLSPPGQGKPTEGYRIDFSQPWTGRVQPFYAWWRDYGLWWAAYKPGGVYVGILPLNPPQWANPPPNPIQIHTGPDHAIEVFAPFVRGTRRWAVVVATADEALRSSKGGANLMMRSAIRLGQNPLDRVKDLVLTWPGMEEIENPRLLCHSSDIPAIRDKARSHPLFRRVLERYPDKPNDPAGLYLATGDERHARAAIDHLLKWLRGWVEDALDGSNYGEALCAITFTRPLRRASLVYDLVAASESMTDAERDYCLRAFAFLAYCLRDENRWPARYQGFSRGNVNFHSDDYTCVATVAALLDGHPKRAEWMDYVARELEFELASSVFPGGAWCEAPNYQGYTMHYLMIGMRAMQLNGFADFTQDPRFKAAMDYFFRIQTPRDVRAGFCLLPTVGDTTSYYHSQSLQNVFAWAASLCHSHDPDFAGRMMLAWHRGGSIVFGAHAIGAGAGWTQPLTLINPDIPEVPPARPLTSERLPGYGALLRSDYGTDRESYFLFKMGQSDQHYDSDEGSFHWYALGVPLSLDFGSMYRPSIVQPWLHSTLDFDRHCTWTRGEVTVFVSLPDLDYCRGELTVNDVQRVPDRPEEKLPVDVPGLIERGQKFIDWRREVLFVRGADYVVIRDDLDDADDAMGTGWTVQVLADSADIEGPRAACVGQHGVDLSVLIAEPAGAELTSSEWGHAGQAAPDWITPEPMGPMAETQIALHTTAGPDADHLAVLFPFRHGEPAPELTPVAPGIVRVVHPAGDDLVFFGPDHRVMQAGDVTFSGRVGFVRRAPDAVILHILEGVSMRVPGMIAQFPGPVTLELRPGHIRGTSDGPARTCFLHWLTDPPRIPAHLTIDGEWRYAYSTFDGYLSFTVPEGQHRFEVRYDRREPGPRSRPARP